MRAPRCLVGPLGGDRPDRPRRRHAVLGKSRYHKTLAAVGLRRCPLTSIHLVEAIRCELLRHALTPGASQASVARLLLERAQPMLRVAAVAVYILDRYGRLVLLASKTSAPGPPLPPLPPIERGSARSVLANWSDESPYADEFVRLRGETPATDALSQYYMDALGELTSLVRIPLNGSSRTFGALDAVNLNWPSPICEEAQFQTESIQQMRLLGMAGASAITVWRARQEAVTLSNLTEALRDIEFHDSAEHWWDQAKAVSTTALERLAAQVGTFRAAVLHVRRGEAELLEVLTKHADPEISWDRWRDLPLEPNQAIAGEAYSRRAPVEVKEITDADASRFTNWDWVRQSGIQSCSSYPLMVGDRVLGTMTVFLSFRDKFAPEGLSLMATFANCFALFWDRVQVGERELAARTETQALRDEHEARRLDERSKVVLHQAKNGWRELQILLKRFEAIDTEGRAREVLRRAQDLAARELATLLDDAALSEPQAIDVGQEVRTMVRNRQLQLRDSRIHVTLVLDDVPLIKMPEHEFKEVLNNLVANAIWAIRQAGRGAGELEIGTNVQTRGKGAKNAELVIWVRDDGVGIPRDSLEDIFRRGFTTSRGKGGTGLGLFLTRSIVESYGGQIRVESRLGEGARFEIRWPLHWISA